MSEIFDSGAMASLALDVRHYLQQSPRQLPSRALYDALGSALFEAICELPWYPITRAERRLIAAHRREVFVEAGGPDCIVELGCGSGEKLSLLLAPDPTAAREVEIRVVHLVDVSGPALGAASRLIHDVHEIPVITHQARYERGLVEAMKTRSAGSRVLLLFLGSNIGNFDPPGADAFLATLRQALTPGDALLIGADLVKPEADLLRAYDDPLGVTAAFNRNLLVRLNRELGANFDLASFEHRALWNAEHSRVEMHLVSRAAQHVSVSKAGVSFDLARGEMIWTESSYKYKADGVAAMLQRAQFEPRRHWIDRPGQFLLMLAVCSA